MYKKRRKTSDLVVAGCGNPIQKLVDNKRRHMKRQLT